MRRKNKPVFPDKKPLNKLTGVSCLQEGKNNYLLLAATKTPVNNLDP